MSAAESIGDLPVPMNLTISLRLIHHVPARARVRRMSLFPQSLEPAIEPSGMNWKIPSSTTRARSSRPGLVERKPIPPRTTPGFKRRRFAATLKDSWSTISSCSFPGEDRHVGNVPHVFQQTVQVRGFSRMPLARGLARQCFSKNTGGPKRPPVAPARNRSDMDARMGSVMVVVHEVIRSCRRCSRRRCRSPVSGEPPGGRRWQRLGFCLPDSRTLSTC